MTKNTSKPTAQLAEAAFVAQLKKLDATEFAKACEDFADTLPRRDNFAQQVEHLKTFYLNLRKEYVKTPEQKALAQKQKEAAHREARIRELGEVAFEKEQADTNKPK